MGFDTNYPNRKDWRKSYDKTAPRCDKSCRPGGSCPYCKINRIKELRQRRSQENKLPDPLDS